MRPAPIHCFNAAASSIHSSHRRSETLVPPLFATVNRPRDSSTRNIDANHQRESFMRIGFEEHPRSRSAIIDPTDVSSPTTRHFNSSLRSAGGGEKRGGKDGP
jgi:hypothetical protein